MQKTLAILTLSAFALAAPAGAQEPEQSKETEEMCNALFVHNAKNVSMQGDTLTMKGISPSVIFFCDRPQRFAGQLGVEEFLSSVSKGKDSFVEDPPNAVVSIVDGDGFADVVVTLAKMPTLDGDQLVYSGVQVIDGEVPEKSGPGSLFIDVIGRPMTPGSIAGAHRRHRRRAMHRCAAGVTCY